MRRWNKVIFLGVTCLALAGCGKDRGDELVKDYQKNDELASDTSADADITGHLSLSVIPESHSRWMPMRQAVESLQKVTAMGQNLWKWMRHI